MIEPLRSAFNASWTESAYEAYKERLAESAGSPIGFRVCESPVFLPPGLRDAMVQGALEIWEELLQPEALERSKAAVPPEFDVPASDDHPLFAQADFAIAEVDGRLAPRLIELQGFPSLYAFQLLQGRLCLEMVPGHGEPLEFLLSGLDDVGYRRVVGDAILGGHPAENVVLLDLDPPGQGTYPDFAATEKLFGIRAVCPTDVTKSGRELWYERDGKKTRILRVYNRLIVDEIVEKKVELPFRFTEELDVEWAGHPNWFFRWSKHALPGLRHPLVPEARLLSDFDHVPDDLVRLGPEAALLLLGHGREGGRDAAGPRRRPGEGPREHAPHAQGGLRAGREGAGRRAVAGRGARHVRLARRTPAAGHDARPALAGQDDGRQVQPRQDLGGLHELPLARTWPAPRDAPVLTGVTRICPFPQPPDFRPSGKAPRRAGPSSMHMGRLAYCPAGDSAGMVRGFGGRTWTIPTPSIDAGS